ncbi:MAG: hypothetical protein AMJ84_04840 [Acidithiobacillales bacterium SM23_46]|nr:MAG: hypothetical protein AMJ84_04840 [Acidithiobacillales bacterium SM23_46]
MADSIYGLTAVEVTGTGAFIQGQVTSLDFENELNKHEVAADGGLYTTFITVMSQKPKFAFDCTAAALALTRVPYNGLKIVPTDTIKFIFAKRLANEVGYDTTHELFTVAKALLLPRQIAARQEEAAAVSIDTYLLSNAGAAPIAHTTSASLPTVTDTTEVFTVGPVHFGATEVDDGIIETTVEWGHEVVLKPYAGKVWNTAAFVRRLRPRVTIRTEDVSLARTIGTTSQVGQATTDDVKVFYRKKTAVGNEADNAAKHLLLTISASQWEVTGITGGLENESEATIVLTPIKSTEAIVAVTTNQQIQGS